MSDFDFKDPIDISIPLLFDGPQPNAYGVETASAKACQYGELVGDTRRGGSCNFEQYTFIPHCNGTHTECVGHITHERISVRDCLKDVIVPAFLVSVTPEMTNGDLVINRRALDIRSMSFAKAQAHASGSALIVRTLPNDNDKISQVYDENNLPPYFLTDAMQFIVESGFKHLLVDLPSIDRLFDEGKLTNHRIFWNVEPGSFELNSRSRINSTITELIYVPDTVADGKYLLNLQIAPFASDASPSRPMIIRIN